jgi:hypothetical protein
VLDLVCDNWLACILEPLLLKLDLCLFSLMFRGHGQVCINSSFQRVIINYNTYCVTVFFIYFKVTNYL